MVLCRRGSSFWVIGHLKDASNNNFFGGPMGCYFPWWSFQGGSFLGHCSRPRETLSLVHLLEDEDHGDGEGESEEENVYQNT